MFSFKLFGLNWDWLHKLTGTYRPQWTQVEEYTFSAGDKWSQIMNKIVDRALDGRTPQTVAWSGFPERPNGGYRVVVDNTANIVDDLYQRQTYDDTFHKVVMYVANVKGGVWYKFMAINTDVDRSRSIAGATYFFVSPTDDVPSYLVECGIRYRHKVPVVAIA